MGLRDEVHCLPSAFRAQDLAGEARAVLGRLIEGDPGLLAAGHLPPQCPQMLGMFDEARKVLQDAMAVSPHRVRRLRTWSRRQQTEVT